MFPKSVKWLGCLVLAQLAFLELASWVLEKVGFLAGWDGASSEVRSAVGGSLALLVWLLYSSLCLVLARGLPLGLSRDDRFRLFVTVGLVLPFLWLAGW